MTSQLVSYGVRIEIHVCLPQRCVYEKEEEKEGRREDTVEGRRRTFTNIIRAP